jgi:hypothetical protein
MEAAQAKAWAQEHSVYERIDRETNRVSQAVNVRGDWVIPSVIRASREPTKSADFDSVVLAHLDAANNLARWLVRDEHDAEDIVQEAYLRAFRFSAGFHGGDSRAWLLKTVRNTAFTWLKRNRPADAPAEFDENIHLALARISHE